jgi:DNA-binding response OmpR family regulator
VKSEAKPALLIVDDDPLITDTLHFVLSQDFEVFVAESRQQVKACSPNWTKPLPWLWWT